MKKIDMSTWERKEIYEFFSRISDPFYMLSFIVDVTELREFTKRHHCSFYYSLIFLCTKAMSSVENFLYVCRDDEVYKIDERTPSFTDRKPESELFHIVTLPMGEDLLTFCQTAGETSKSQKSFLDFSQEGDGLVYFTCVPTLRLTALTNEFDIFASNYASDSVPRIAWGKYTEHQGRWELTLSVEVNHRFIDGIHIEKFAACLESLIADLAGK